MRRLLALLFCLEGFSAPAIAQTTDGGFTETLSTLLAASTKAMHATFAAIWLRLPRA